MRNMKKFIALVSAMAMAVCPTVVSADVTTTASPATGGAASSGEIEDIIDKEVFVAILPTAGSTDATFNFTLDPQELLKETTGAALGGNKVFHDNTGLYFANADGSYSSSSDAVVLETKTSTDCAVKVDIEVTLTSAAGVSFVSNAAACTGTDTNIYLAVEASNAAILTDNAGAATSVAIGTDGKASVETTNAGLPETSFETKYSGGSYSYGLTADADTADGSKFEFNLVGACNKDADWKDVKDMAADVDVVWTITKSGAESAKTNNYSVTNGGTFYLTSNLKTNGTPKGAVSSIKYGPATAVTNTLATSKYTYNKDAGTITLNSGIVGSGAVGQERTFKITYGDNTTETITVTVAQ